MASDLAEAALKVRTEFLGHTDLTTLASLGMLALVLQAQGKYAAAEEMNRRALEGYEKVLGRDHPIHADERRESGIGAMGPGQVRSGRGDISYLF